MNIFLLCDLREVNYQYIKLHPSEWCDKYTINLKLE
uniref:Uncharacterized protein n=1 Tax=Arundo donax TaxID=35708 RepID=A0A0A8YJX3_ARUDO